MSAERELLRQLQRLLADADVDTTELVESAWAEAQAEVHATLKRLVTHDLLRRVVGQLGGTAPPPAVEDAERPPAWGPTRERSDRDGGPRPTPTPAADTAPPAPARPADPPAGPPIERAVRPGTAEAPDGRVTYLFGIVPAAADIPLDELPSLPAGAPARSLELGPVRAVVSDVDADAYRTLGTDPADLDTLAAVAYAHDAILAHVAAHAAVLPLGLGTTFADDDAVRAAVAPHVDELHRELQRFEGHAEWAVTVRLVDQATASQQDADAADSGRDYLQRRREALRERESRWAVRQRIADDIHGRIAALAVADDTVGSRPIEDGAPPLLHGVYLVADDRRDELAATVDELRAEHAHAVIEVSGPWPPYHFTTLELGGAGGGP